MEFREFGKIARLSRDIIITEKIDGTNGQIAITEDGQMFVGSRTRWITPEDDNYGFARWCLENKEELLQLGPGRHFGEWWGQGIQRKYGMGRKVFSLFNVSRWSDEWPGKPRLRPACCSVVPVLYKGPLNMGMIDFTLLQLRHEGSRVAPGFMRPEGVVVFHGASGTLFKKTLEKDEVPKSLVK